MIVSILLNCCLCTDLIFITINLMITLPFDKKPRFPHSRFGQKLSVRRPRFPACNNTYLAIKSDFLSRLDCDIGHLACLYNWHSTRLHCNEERLDSKKVSTAGEH